MARPLDAASVGVASKNVRATTAAATADTTIVVRIWLSLLFARKRAPPRTHAPGTGAGATSRESLRKGAQPTRSLRYPLGPRPYRICSRRARGAGDQRRLT